MNVKIVNFSIINSLDFSGYAGIDIVESYSWPSDLPRLELLNIQILNCIIENNHIGLRATNTTKILIENCTINNNSGHSIYFNECSKTNIENCMIFNNGIDNSDKQVKGGITNSNIESTFLRENHKIINCSIFDNVFCGISLKDVTNVLIIKNKIVNNSEFGIYIQNHMPLKHVIKINDNFISSALVEGIRHEYYPGPPDYLTIPKTVDADEITIEKNNLQSNNQGLYINDNIIKAKVNQNNFIKNRVQASFRIQFPTKNPFVLTWDDNYWDNYHGNGPKIIFGILYKPYKFILIPTLTIDKNPAAEPFDTTNP